MTLSRKTIFSIIGLLSCALLVSCGNTQTSEPASASKSEADLFSKISQEEFNKTVKQINVYKDEFTGEYEVGSRANIHTVVGTSLMGIALAILKKDSQSDWYPVFVFSYGGKDWMFHDEFNMKSNEEVLSLKIESNTRDDQVESGYVTEISAYMPSDSEVSLFCKIIVGEDFKFRIQGTRGKVKELVGSMTDEAKIGNLEICTVYAGLKQGFKISE